MAARVLITGATGFAGSFLVERYAANGWDVHGTYRTLSAGVRVRWSMNRGPRPLILTPGE